MSWLINLEKLSLKGLPLLSYTFCATAMHIFFLNYQCSIPRCIRNWVHLIVIGYEAQVEAIQIFRGLACTRKKERSGWRFGLATFRLHKIHSQGIYPLASTNRPTCFPPLLLVHGLQRKNSKKNQYINSLKYRLELQSVHASYCVTQQSER